MKSRKSRFLCLAVALVAFAGLPALAGAGDPQNKVLGNAKDASGNFVSVSAHDTATDPAWGHLNLTNRELDRRVKSDVECVNLTSPQDATVSGRIREGSTGVPLGATHVVVDFHDGGEPGGGGDRINAVTVTYTIGLNCNPLPANDPIVSGQIHVIPASP